MISLIFRWCLDNIITADGGRVVLAIYIALIIILYICSKCYFSDSNIVKRVISRRRTLYNSIKTMTISRKCVSVCWLSSRGSSIRRDMCHIIGFHQKENGVLDLEKVIECNSTCSICLCEFQVKDRVKRLPCGHLFHKACLDPWFLDVTSSCPVCKQHITRQGMVPKEKDRTDYELMKALRSAEEEGWRVETRKKVSKFWCWFIGINLLIIIPCL